MKKARKTGAIRFCYRTPSFPKRAFIGFVHVMQDEQPVSLYPFEFLYTSFDAFRTEAAGFRNHFAKQNLDISDVAILVPIALDRLIRLKAAYWKQPDYARYYGTEIRIGLFADMLNAPPLHAVLVSSRGTDRGREYFSAAAPFLKSVTDGMIEQFMFQSDYPVDEASKFAAVYMAEEPIIINWVEQKLVQPERQERASN